MFKTLEVPTEKPFIITHTPTVLVTLALVLLSLFGSMWWTRVYNSPRRVFAGMLSNNLSTTSVTKRTTTSGQQGFDRVEQISFVPPLSTRSYVKLSEATASGNTTVQSETIGTVQSDYSRYLKIDVTPTTGSPLPNYASVEGEWAQSTLAEGQPQYLNQALQGLVPFANLNPEQRVKILKLIEDKKVYTVNYASTKPRRLNGKSAIDYSVTVNPSQYVTMLKEIATMIGVKELAGLNAEDYKDQPPISLSVVVDKISRQVLEVTYGQQKETYSAYGLSRPTAIPEKTITPQALQQKIQAAQ